MTTLHDRIIPTATWRHIITRVNVTPKVKATTAQTNGKPNSTGSARPTAGDRSRLIDEVGAGIDHLLFTPEVEAALRAARRLLTGGHGG